jgi:hypothetical protein
MLVGVGLFVGLSALTAVSQEPGAPAIPLSKAVPTTFRSLIVYDGRFTADDPRNRQDKIHCLVCENGLAPVVAVFAKQVPSGADTPLGKLLKALQPLIPKYRGDRFGSYVIFLRTSDEVDPATKDVVITKDVTVKQADGTEAQQKLDKEFPDDSRIRTVPRDDGKGNKTIDYYFLREDEIEAIRGKSPKQLGGFAEAVGTPQIPLGLAAEKSSKTKEFGIGDEPDTITVILYNRLFIKHRWTFKPDELTDEKIKEIVDAAEKEITDLSK